MPAANAEATDDSQPSLPATPSDASPAAPAELAAAPLSWPKRVMRLVRFTIGLLACAVIFALALVEAFAWLLPQRFDDADRQYVRLVLISYFARTFLFYAAIPVLLAAVVAFTIRWRRLALVGLLIGAAMLAPMMRDYLPKSKPVVHGPTLRLMSMNVFTENRNYDAIHAAIAEANPDVIVLIELDGRNWHPIVDPLLPSYPYTYSGGIDGQGGLIVSRLPFQIPTTRPALPNMPTPIVFSLGGRELELYSVHFVSPRRHTWYIERNRQQTERFRQLAASTKRPIVIAGDFNFSQLSPNYAHLCETGLRSSQQIIGFGVGNTWGPIWEWGPFSARWMNRLAGFRIDHILLSPALTATSHRVGPDTGSDHRPVIADIGFADEGSGDSR